MGIFTVFAVGAILYLAFANPFIKGGHAQTVEGMIPHEHASLRGLAKDLAVHNEKVHKALKSDAGSIRSLGWFMSRYPEKFNAPADWFEKVAQTKEIPTSKIEALLEIAGTGPVSTNEAADWLLEVYMHLERESSAENQQIGVNALRGPDKSPIKEDAARQVAEKAVALMFIDLKLTSMTPETASFEAVVAGKKCDIDLANNVSPEPNRWLVTKLNCES
ncbi:hypothetical protein CL689_02685 [Candidatus Saccharibacteria bacterium]|nr:hypothetical protein [Candidatus Saccharibacteria bacterium]